LFQHGTFWTTGNHIICIPPGHVIRHLHFSSCVSLIESTVQETDEERLTRLRRDDPDFNEHEGESLGAVDSEEETNRRTGRDLPDFVVNDDSVDYASSEDELARHFTAKKRRIVLSGDEDDDNSTQS
jgi:hypothetical protein